MNTVKVEYPGTPGKQYSYYVPEGLVAERGIEVDDWVIVDSPFTAFTAVKVVELVPDSTAQKAVIGFADMSWHTTNQANIKRKAEIEADLDRRAQRLDKLQRYELLGNFDESAKVLLEELLTLK